MSHAITSQNAIRTSINGVNQLHFSGGVTRYVTPPPSYEVPDDGTMVGMVTQVRLIIVAKLIVFLNIGTD